MKILLTLILCSYVQGSCLQPYQWPMHYNDMYDCFEAGYELSLKKMKEIGRTEVNKEQIYIRFTCVPAATT
jgi:hypothetical protein